MPGLGRKGRKRRAFCSSWIEIEEVSWNGGVWGRGRKEPGLPGQKTLSEECRKPGSACFYKMTLAAVITHSPCCLQSPVVPFLAKGMPFIPAFLCVPLVFAQFFYKHLSHRFIIVCLCVTEVLSSRDLVLFIARYLD